MFYDLTYVTALKFVQARIKHQRDNLLIKAKLDYTNTEHLSLNISKMFGGKGNVPIFEDLYSFLLDNEIKDQIEQAKINAAKERAAAQFTAWANAFNAKHEGGE